MGKQLLTKTRSGANFLPWYLISGSLAFAVMTCILGVISRSVIDRRPLTLTDSQLSSWLEMHRPPGFNGVMLFVTSLGASVAITCLTVAFLIYLLVRRRLHWLVAVASTVIGGVLLNRLLKFAFHRARPSFSDPILTLTSYSFPSGHTMAATIFYGVVAAYFVAQTQDRSRRALIMLAALLVIALVGFSRIYLGAHYLSDVLGAMAEGFAWLSLCLTVVYSFWRKRNNRPA